MTDRFSGFIAPARNGFMDGPRTPPIADYSGLLREPNGLSERQVKAVTAALKAIEMRELEAMYGEASDG